MTAGGGGADTRDLRAGDVPAARRAPQPGDLFDGRYQIEALLGEGGFGCVYAARDTSLGRDVAIKVLSRATEEPTALARFLQEARTAASLESEHVALVHEVGVLHGVPYLVMERLRGRDLHDELAARTRFPVAEAIDLVLQAALGVAHAHARGIIHRDLKPRNLFLAQRSDGTQLVKVLDFGIAKTATVELTGTGDTLGTTRYMAPEQLRSSRSVDVRADIWALGVVLYELTTGSPIFDATNGAELGVLILSDPHVPLRAREPELSPELEAIVDRCLAKEPADRYADLGAFARALALLGGSAGMVTRIKNALGAGSSTASTAVRESPSRPRRISPVLVAALALGGAGIGVAVVLATRTNDAPAEEKRAEAPVPVVADARSSDAAVVVVAEAPPIDAAAVAPIDAAPKSPPDSAPRPAAGDKPPVNAKVTPPKYDEIYKVCSIQISYSEVPGFLVPGASGKSFTCGELARLGCATIKARCASDPITDDEKRKCRDFVARLRTKVCPS